MRENELADLLIRMAADRGVDVEPAADELASISLPSFVDARSFRGAVVHALEAHLRSQMEQRLQLIRQRFDLDQAAPGSAQPRPGMTPSAVNPTPEPARPASEPVGVLNMADVTMAEMSSVSQPATPDDGQLKSEEEELPSDATMIWTTRHG